jgi:hypothetical protein
MVLLPQQLMNHCYAHFENVLIVLLVIGFTGQLGNGHCVAVSPFTLRKYLLRTSSSYNYSNSSVDILTTLFVVVV